jgi:hypothetical protein
MDEQKKGPGDETASQGPNTREMELRQRGINDASDSALQKPLFADAEALTAAGYELIPLHRWNETRAGKNGKIQQLGKAPRDKAWTTKKYTNENLLADARATYINLGVRLRTTDLIVDVDPRNGGNESLERLKMDLALDLDAYAVVATGSGGRHFYMRKPAHISTVGKIEGYNGIDFKTAGGQVVAPGSVHPNGRRYQSEFFLVGPGETPEAPAKLLERLQVRKLPRPDGVEDADRWGEVEPEQLAETLEKIPPDDFGAGEHDKWFLLMCACHHATAGAGRQEFIAWSTTASGYEDHAELIGYRWDSLSKKGTGRPVTINYLYKVLKKYGDEVARVAAEQDFDVVAVDNQALPTLRRMKNGKPESTFPNCLRLVRHLDEQMGLIYDEFGCATHLLADPLPWTVDVGRRLSDDVIRQIRQCLVETCDVNWSKDDVCEAVLTVAREKTIHPVRDFLAALEWDRTPRLDSLLIRYAGAADNAYVRAIGAKTLIAAVRRVRQPGCKFDNVIVLEGGQGCGKSSFVKALCPAIEWFSDSPIGNTESKDAPLSLQGRWIIELGEMSVLSKSGVEALKQFVSSSIDHVRRPYGRMHEELRRQCIFIGTTNQAAYLKDQTGNRRFWPVKVGTIDLDALIADRDQLWAEAAAREASCESLVLPRELWDVAAIEQEERVSDDPWVDTLRAYLDGTPGADGIGPVEPIDRVHSVTLLTSALSIRISEHTAAHMQRVRMIMEKHLGWKHKQNVRVGANQGKGYVRQ